MNTFTPALSERKRILKKICRNHAQWKGRIALSVILIAIAIGIMGYIAYLLTTHHTSTFGIFIFLCVGICLASVPFFISLSVKNTAKYKCALPYSSYANGLLLLKNDTLEYIFWRVGPSEPAAYSSKRAVYKDEDKFVYLIKKTDINSIEIRDDVCKIIGNGIVQMPEWAEEDTTVKRINKEFSFIMAFKEKNADKIINEWRMNVEA